MAVTTAALNSPRWQSSQGQVMMDPMVEEKEKARVLEQLQVLRAQMGDEEAHAALFRAYYDKLLYYLRRILKDPAEAEDVLQEVWITVLRRIGTLEQPGAFKTWLYRVARNRAISRLRKSRHHLDLDEVSEEQVAVDPRQEQGEEELVRGYDSASVHRALQFLTPPHREVLTLRFLEHLSYDEVAEVVGCSVGTIRSRIHYAKRSLKETLVEGR